MTPRRLTAELSVAPQIAAADVADLAARGFRAIVCNRPDGEGADQPLFAEIESAAIAAGLHARYVPVIAGKMTDEDAARFAAVIGELPVPVLAYCRSGTRSTILWALTQTGRMPPGEIERAAREAGFDVSGVAGRIAAGGNRAVAKSRETE